MGLAICTNQDWSTGEVIKLPPVLNCCTDSSVDVLLTCSPASSLSMFGHCRIFASQYLHMAAALMLSCCMCCRLGCCHCACFLWLKCSLCRCSSNCCLKEVNRGLIEHVTNSPLGSPSVATHCTHLTLSMLGILGIGTQEFCNHLLGLVALTMWRTYFEEWFARLTYL